MLAIGSCQHMPAQPLGDTHIFQAINDLHMVVRLKILRKMNNIPGTAVRSYPLAPVRTLLLDVC